MTSLLVTSFRIFIFLISIVNFSVHAFENDYLQFGLPSTWSCEQKASRWICSPQSPEDTTEAIIIVSAKIAGPEDNLQFFLRYLGRPKMLANQLGVNPIPSKVFHAKSRMIGPQQWIEGLHLGSEVKDFYTLYLATKYEGLSILVSLSADKIHAEKYQETFANIVKTLSLKKLPLRKRLAQKLKTGVPAVDQAVDSALVNAPSTQSLLDTILSSKLLTAMTFAFIAMIAGLAIYAFK